MAELTLDRALDYTEKLWCYLYDHPDEEKEHWLGWSAEPELSVLSPKVLEEFFYCPLCLYSEGQPKRFKSRMANTWCVNCPYYQVWGFCDSDDSPYNLWRSFSSTSLRKWCAAQLLERIRGLKAMAEGVDLHIHTQGEKE